MCNYTNLKPFKFWCQKVLPLVYDDSLSYYELLCKVVEYLNNIIKDMNVFEDKITELENKYSELKRYVDNYFENLDVSDAINKKLDDMAISGELSAIFNRYTSAFIVPRYLATCYKSVKDAKAVEGEALIALSDNKFLACFSPIKYDATSTATINLISIDKYTVTVEKESNVTGLYHINDGTLLDGYAWIACGGDSNKLAKVNTSTLVVEETYTFTDSFSHITTYNEKLITVNNGAVYELDIESLTLKHIVDLVPFYNTQSIVYYNGVLYVFGGDHLTIRGYSIKTGLLMFSNTVNNFTDNKHNVSFFAGCSVTESGMLVGFMNHIPEWLATNRYNDTSDEPALFCNYLCSFSSIGDSYGFASSHEFKNSIYIKPYSDGWCYATGTGNAPLLSIGESIDLNIEAYTLIFRGDYISNGILIARNKNIIIASMDSVSVPGAVFINSSISSRGKLTLTKNLKLNDVELSPSAIIINSSVYCGFIANNSLNKIVAYNSKLYASADDLSQNIVPDASIELNNTEIQNYVPTNVTIGTKHVGQVLYENTKTNTVFDLDFRVRYNNSMFLLIALINGKQSFGLFNYTYGNNIILSDGTTASINNETNVLTLGASASKICIVKLQ